MHLENARHATVQTGAAFICRWWDIASGNDEDAQPKEEVFAAPCGQVTPYDAEMIALQMGL